MSLPAACRDCKKSEREVRECRVRLVQFSVYGRRCPREEPSKPKVVAELEGDRYLEIPLELIYWKDTVRAVLKQQDIVDMASSLRLHKQIEPIVVKPPDEDGRYEGVIGRLRYEGAKYAHLETILARVHQFKSQREVREWQLVENLHRRQLTELEKDEAYKELYDLIKEQRRGVYDQHIVKDIAKKIEELTGEKPAERTIQKRIKIARELPERVKEVLKTVTGDGFGIRHAEQLLRLKGMPEKQLRFAEEFVATVIKGKPMTVEKLKKKVDSLIEPPKPEEPIFTCILCGAKLTEKKLAKRMKDIEKDPALYSMVKERYKEVFNIDESAEDS
jgi:ParB/RepB/Spo0J family partition protein